jgi:hypothetical protein
MVRFTASHPKSLGVQTPLEASGTYAGALLVGDYIPSLAHSDTELSDTITPDQETNAKG